MGMIDDMKSKFGDMSQDMQDRYNELRDKEESGTLDDQGRTELQQLRDRMKS